MHPHDLLDWLFQASDDAWRQLPATARVLGTWATVRAATKRH